MKSLLIPLFKYPDYRYLFLGQTISLFGTMISYVCLPFQMYQLTHSPFMVGLIGICELIPILIFAPLGGASADRFNRKKLLIISEIVLILCMAALMINAFLPAPKIWPLFVFVFILMAANSYHRPAMESMVQKIVEPKDYVTISGLSSMRYTIGGILGPALGGTIVGLYGIGVAYLVDLLTFIISLFFVMMISKSYQAEHQGVNKEPQNSGSWNDIKLGLAYARGNQTLLGTYFIDIIAMTFAYPVVLFPMLLATWGVSETYLGWPMSAIALGSFVPALLNSKVGQISKKGRMVSYSALAWGFCIIIFGLTHQFYVALFLLFLSGMTDGFSAMFRSVIWNESVPNQMRGRLAGIEMIGYMTGPLLGNFRAGTMAGWLGVSEALTIGGVICVAGVLVTSFFLPQFWDYHSPDLNLK